MEEPLGAGEENPMVEKAAKSDDGGGNTILTEALDGRYRCTPDLDRLAPIVTSLVASPAITPTTGGDLNVRATIGGGSSGGSSGDGDSGSSQGDR